MSEQVLDQDTNNSAPAEPAAKTNVLEELVGEGKKYKDPESFVKSFEHKEEHIAKLERELAEIREDLSKRVTAEDVLAQMKAQKTEPAENTTPQVDVEELVRKTLDSERQKSTATQNLSQVNELLVKTYGDKAGEAITAKASELGVGVDKLKDMAAESPELFKRVVGLSDKPAQTTPQGFDGGIRTEGQVGNDTDYKAYYREMRRTNPSKYHSLEESNKRAELISAGKL